MALRLIDFCDDSVKRRLLCEREGGKDRREGGFGGRTSYMDETYRMKRGMKRRRERDNTLTGTHTHTHTSKAT